MKEYLENIINEYNDFNNYLKDINIGEFKQYTRTELIEFTEVLRKVDNFRNIIFDVNNIINDKKLEEYPELLGVHNYPEIKELDCISEKDKIILDDFLANNRRSVFIYLGSPFWNKISKEWNQTTQDIIFKFLVDKRIVEKFYNITFCCNSEIFSQVKVNNYLSYFNNMDENGMHPTEYYINNLNLIASIEYELDGFCDECDSEYKITKEPIENAVKNSSCHYYRVIKARDNTYDNK